jgi:ribose 5-phosphate isomerase A
VSETLKQAIGDRLAARTKTGDIIGIGTGSTVQYAIEAIGRRVRTEGISIRAVVTSYQSAEACGLAGIEVLDFQGWMASSQGPSGQAAAGAGFLNWGFDGADEVDQRCRAIKGKGAALLREKIVAAVCREFVLLVDYTKVSDRLGVKSAVPVECVPESWWYVTEGLRCLGATHSELRSGLPGKHGPVITERGNVVLDAMFSEISDDLEGEIKKITGVVENGIFTFQATQVLVAGGDGTIEEWQSSILRG